MLSIHRTLIFSVAFLVSCGPKDKEGQFDEFDTSSAIFVGAGPTESLSFEYANFASGELTVAFEDVSHEVKLCDKRDYHFCLESPLELYVPKKMGKYNFSNTKGESVEVVVTTHRNQANESLVCELNEFWVSVQNETSKYTSNFHFDHERGLVALFETLEVDNGNYEPILAYSLNKGSVFELVESCGNGSE